MNLHTKKVLTVNFFVCFYKVPFLLCFYPHSPPTSLPSHSSIPLSFFLFPLHSFSSSYRIHLFSFFIFFSALPSRLPLFSLILLIFSSPPSNLLLSFSFLLFLFFYINPSLPFPLFLLLLLPFFSCPHPYPFLYLFPFPISSAPFLPSPSPPPPFPPAFPSPKFWLAILRELARSQYAFFFFFPLFPLSVFPPVDSWRRLHTRG